MYLRDIESSKDIGIPRNPIDRVVGQHVAIEKIKVAVKQRRHLLLVGPPGIGKSMVAQALALSLSKPKEEIRVFHNPENPERPILKIVTSEELKKGGEGGLIGGEVVTPASVPSFVAECLGFRCLNCGTISSAREQSCPSCGTDKYKRFTWSHQKSPLGDIITEVFEFGGNTPETEIKTTRTGSSGKEITTIYQRVAEDKVRVLDGCIPEKVKKRGGSERMKILVPIDRIPFVHATGASETELLGDVKHDPYGSHPEIGTPAYLRIVPGAVHEAHEGVLFIDELPALEHIQGFILTAMQEKNFPIVGRNPHSSGASVKVDSVPCDFILVGACNIRDINKILPALRSRTIGCGYEILLETTMPDNDANRAEIARFVAQEIESDGRIPHASREAVEEVIKIAKKKAWEVDSVRKSLTLRLRDLGGFIRMAGDLAISENSELIERKHIKRSFLEAKPIEHQLQEKYGSVWRGMSKDSGVNPTHTEGIDGYG